MIPFLENKKVWGVPYLKIEKLPPFHFMCFDRYENHTQDFANVLYGKFIIFNPHLRKIIETYILIFKKYRHVVKTYRHFSNSKIT